MATSYFITTTPAATVAAYMSIIETGLTAMGWTLLDSISSSHHVWRMPNVAGASGVYFPLEIDGSSPGFISLQLHSDWDVSTHTGIGSPGTYYWATTADPIYFYCNPFCLYLFVRNATNPYEGFAGLLKTLQTKGKTDGLTRSTASMTAGATSVTVQDNLTSRLYVGQTVAIQNFAHSSSSANKTNRELVTITSVSAGSLGFTATSNAYDSGARIGPPDMLCTLSPHPSAIYVTSGNMSVVGVNISQGTGNDVAYVLPNFNTSSGSIAALQAATTGGMVPQSFTPVCGVTGITETALSQQLCGFIYVTTTANGTTPAAGTKYTDGTNVWVQMTAAVTTPSLMQVAGPTGDVPNFSTMTRIVSPLAPYSDSFYTQVATGGSPPSALNQGLN